MGKTSVSGLGSLIKQNMFHEASLTELSSGRTLGPIIDDYVLGTPASVNTTQNPNYPLIATSVSFNADPFDVFPFNVGVATMPNQSATRSIYVDITDRIQEVDASLGRQYELDLISAGVATFNILDRDEAFNPSNTGSPYYPNVKVYRAIFDGAMWPPVPAGSAVNLLNLSAYYPIDPTFDSYFIPPAVGAIEPPSPWLYTRSGIAYVTNTNPFSGVNHLAVFAIAGDPFVYAGWMVPCIPGQKYTSSVYVYSSQAIWLGLCVYDGFNSGTHMNVAGVYTRLQVTFTATKPVHIIMISSDGMATLPDCEIDMDNFQHECGGVANAFATTGPLIAGLFGGFVERWPSSWNFHGTYGMAQITATDAFAVMSNHNLDTELYDAILTTLPAYYWPLNESTGATAFGEKSGNEGPSLINYVSKYGGATAPAAGTELGIVGDAGGTGVFFTAQTTASSQVGTIIGTGQLVDRTNFNWPVLSTTTWSASIGVWVNTDVTIFSPHDDQLLTWSPIPGPNPAEVSPFSIDIDSGGQFQVFYSGATTFSQLFGAGPVLTDKLPHFLVATITQVSGGNTTVTAYIDGAQVNQAIVTTASLGGNAKLQPVTFMAGGLFAGSPVGPVYTQILNGSMSHLTLWNRELTSLEVLDVWLVGSQAYANDSTGQRIQRYVDHDNFSLADIDFGLTFLQASKVTSGTAILDAIQEVSASENGNFFFDGFGTAVFQDRSHRYLETTPSAVFGENPSGGEISYSDDINFDYDPTLIFNSVEVDQVDGIKAVAEDIPSQDSYGSRSTQISTLTNSVGEPTDYANWVLVTHKQPTQRVSGVTINPAANPSLWPVAIGAKLGDRVTVVRRTPAFTMRSDYFIERIERSRGVDLTFTVTFQMSPVLLQPWIVEDATFGMLDQTTVCGF